MWDPSRGYLFGPAEAFKTLEPHFSGAVGICISPGRGEVSEFPQYCLQALRTKSRREQWESQHVYLPGGHCRADAVRHRQGLSEEANPRRVYSPKLLMS